ncbi:spermidine/putrescine-binding periplasmic protein [Leptolyngbyaceae cyanobacterium JSC-12]|nr:spermidine/putrescine-binding periplasmic protein [Leptolyngbyaceae cyanobacterium JSC-12]
MNDEIWQVPISRRLLLRSSGYVTIGSLLASCSGQAASTLQILFLRGSIPPQLLGEFHKVLSRQNLPGVNLDADSKPQLQALFSQLQTWKQSPPDSSSNSFWDWIPDWVPFLGNRTKNKVPNLMTLGDFWLGMAIAQGLISPIDVSSLPTWTKLAQFPQFKQLVTRNQQGQLDPDGQIWALPYRIGTTVIAYRRDIFEQRNLQPPTDWSDLWRKDLRRRIALLNNPREVIGLTLKKLGKSYNTEDLASVPTLQQELNLLQEQVKYYSSTSYLQPLLLDDVWLAVGWSTDVLPLMQRSRQIAAIAPRSGTALSADLWVHPAMTSTALPAAALQWIEFCWQTKIATQLSLATWAVSPSLIGTPDTQLLAQFRDYPALLPNIDILQASEFLLPLSETATKQYRDLWLEMRS